MNTTLLKRFATEARKILLQGVGHRLEGMGFDLQTGKAAEMPQLLGGGAVFMGNVVSTQFYERWMSLYNNVQHRGIRDVAEEAAYTWFNRFVAIRILSRQHFISPVLEYESEDIHIPFIVSEARHGRMPDMPQRIRKELEELLNDDSKTNEQFALLIVAFCHSNPIINRCFGNITDYTELLLPQDILREDGFVDMLNNTPFISEEDYGSSTLIGWLYQFYISERKDEVFAKKGKYDADEIAPATQIFTPEWIVQYMVQNTLGRIYLDNNPYAADDFKPKWKYLVDQEQRDDEHICHFDNLEDIRCADLGCGSGHIVGYMFEVLYDLYLYEGYSRREAVEHILKENLTGVDIDQRAKQLATFALLLKACQKDKSFTDAKVMPKILDMPDPFTEDKANEDNIIREQSSHFILGSDTKVLNEMVDAIKLMDAAKTLGSIMKFDISERTRNILQVRLEDYEQQMVIPEAIKKMIPYVRVILALTQKHTALVMNPPYMGSSRFDSVLSKYVKDNYATGKADLFSVFMLMAKDRLIYNGKYAMINMQSWMFLSSFEQLRKDLLETMQIDSMLHLGPHTFDELSGEVVQNTAFVVSNMNVAGDSECCGTYYRLVDGKNCLDKEHMLLENRDGNVDGAKVYYPNVKQKDFEKIPGCPIGYWLSKKYINLFEIRGLHKVVSIREGLITADNQRYLRLWFEPNFNSINFNCCSSEESEHLKEKWYPYNKAGSYRKWYGCRDYVVNWQNNGEDIKDFKDSKGKLRSRPQNTNTYFKVCFSWSNITSGPLAFRYFEQGFIYDGCANAAFPTNGCDIFYILGYSNTKVVKEFKGILNPTMHFNPGDFENLPFKNDCNNKLSNLAKENITISKLDWDSHETSWDFAENPLVAIMKQAEGEEPMSSTSETDGFKAGNQWSSTEKPTVSRQETDGFAAENHNDRAEAVDDHDVVTANPKRGNDVTKAWEDDYQSVVNDLHGLCHPTDGVTSHGSTLELCVKAFEKLWTARFMQLHANEEELNRQFIDIYGLQDELTPDVPLNEITILQQNEIAIKNDKIVWNEDTLIKQLISYAVGVCMGRYRLDKPGLQIAYPNPSEEELAPYTYKGEKISIDDDAIIPLMSRDCPFTDNMLQRLIDFIRVVFGADSLTENLNFMEKSLGMTLEQYLQKNFWKDHKRMYQNRPIYWLFSSKKDAFQCIAYMHRMDAWTAERVRTKYLLPYIEHLVNKQNDLQNNAANLTSIERRELDKVTKQIAECREYHDRLHEVADKEIAFDLDDGVVVNYAKFGDVLFKIK